MAFKGEFINLSSQDSHNNTVKNLIFQGVFLNSISVIEHFVIPTLSPLHLYLWSKQNQQNESKIIIDMLIVYVPN